MYKSILILALWVTALVKGSLGRLITTPNNTMYIGLRISINCSSSMGSDAINWYFIPVDETTNITIATGSTVDTAYTDLFWIDQPTPTASNIITPYPYSPTAGTYVCADNETMARAELIVFYANRVSTNASDSLIDGDVISLYCSFTYLGNPFIIPNFYLYNISVNLKYGIHTVIDTIHGLIDNSTSTQWYKSNSQITATGTFYQTASCPMFPELECRTSFGTPVGNLLPDSATNAPLDLFSIYFPPKSVSCVPTDNDVSTTSVTSGAIQMSDFSLEVVGLLLVYYWSTCTSCFLQ